MRVYIHFDTGSDPFTIKITLPKKWNDGPVSNLIKVGLCAACPDAWCHTVVLPPQTFLDSYNAKFPEGALTADAIHATTARFVCLFAIVFAWYRRHSAFV